MDRVAPPVPHIDEPAAAPRPRHRLVRSARDRVISGVAGGIGERLGVDPTVVRLAFVALSLAAGIGVLAYLVAVLVSVEPEQGAPAPAVAGTSVRQALAVGLIVLGVLLLLRASGLWFGDRVVCPVVLGRGRTLFEGVKERLNLKLTKSRAFGNGNVVLWYEPTA